MNLTSTLAETATLRIPSEDNEVPQNAAPNETKIVTEGLNLFYGPKQALKDINISVAARQVTALIGPSGCGKSTYLRSINRMNDLIAGVRIEGSIKYDGLDIYGKGLDVSELRKRIGMVFQKSNPFPKTIYENIVYGPKLLAKRTKIELNEIVEKSLKQAALWDEVKDRLHQSALGLSGGQQQRLCIARALAVGPDVLLMDEPASALDPISTFKIEELIFELKQEYTIVIVTHNMQQAARVSDVTAFFYMGEVVEIGKTKNIFTNPRKQQTEDYVTGRFG